MSVNAKMTAIADAIRLKTGRTDTLTLDQMADDLNAISERDSTDLIINGATVTIPAGNYQSQVSGSVYTATQATPSIAINASGLITATATQTAGYVTAGTKSATKQLAFQSAKTITPGTASQTAISKGTYATGSVVVEGDSNLKASNIVSGVSIFGVSGTYSGGDTSIEDGLVQRTLGSYSNSRVSTIGSYAFYCASNLYAVSFANCTVIGRSAFEKCSNLTTIDFPNCTAVGSFAFSQCSRLTSVNLPKCDTINYSAFYCCYSLTSIDLPKCLTILGDAFMGCTYLTTISLPQCRMIGPSALRQCGLTNIYAPLCSTVGSNAFYGCSKLTTASLPTCSFIHYSAFMRCSNLSSIYLASSSICTLQHSNVFSSTGITSTTGSIYVPLSLGWSYKHATNWTYFSNRIFSIEGDDIVDPDAGGDDIGGGGTGELITFTIIFDEYQAEDGMTWGEWVESPYNTDGIYLSVDTKGVLLNPTEQVCDENLIPVYENDRIVADMIYDACRPEI